MFFESFMRGMKVAHSVDVARLTNDEAYRRGIIAYLGNETETLPQATVEAATPTAANDTIHGDNADNTDLHHAA